MAGKNGSTSKMILDETEGNAISLELGAIHASLRCLSMATREGGHKELGQEAIEHIVDDVCDRAAALKNRLDSACTVLFADEVIHG